MLRARVISQLECIVLFLPSTTKISAYEVIIKFRKHEESFLIVDFLLFLWVFYVIIVFVSHVKVVACGLCLCSGRAADLIRGLISFDVYIYIIICHPPCARGQTDAVVVVVMAHRTRVE